MKTIHLFYNEQLHSSSSIGMTEKVHPHLSSLFCSVGALINLSRVNNDYEIFINVIFILDEPNFIMWVSIFSNHHIKFFWVLVSFLQMLYILQMNFFLNKFITKQVSSIF